MLTISLHFVIDGQFEDKFQPEPDYCKGKWGSCPESPKTNNQIFCLKISTNCAQKHIIGSPTGSLPRSPCRVSETLISNSHLNSKSEIIFVKPQIE